MVETIKDTESYITDTQQEGLLKKLKLDLENYFNHSWVNCRWITLRESNSQDIEIKKLAVEKRKKEKEQAQQKSAERSMARKAAVALSRENSRKPGTRN